FARFAGFRFTCGFRTVAVAAIAVASAATATAARLLVAAGGFERLTVDVEDHGVGSGFVGDRQGGSGNRCDHQLFGGLRHDFLVAIFTRRAGCAFATAFAA